MQEFSSNSSNCFGFSGSKFFSIINDLNLSLLPFLGLFFLSSIEDSKSWLDAAVLVLIFAERLEKIDKILFLNKSTYRYELQDKIRKELNRGLNKENLLSEDDKILLYKLYLKLKKEFQDIDNSKL